MKTVFLGIIQGVSEILPISSSVNLYFFSHFFRIDTFSFSLKIALHIGSLFGILLFFRKEMREILRGIFFKKNISDSYFWPLVFGTIPVVILGFTARNFVREFNSPKIMGILSITFGILLVVFDKASSTTKGRDRKPISIFKSFIIGCFQSISIFPGISRLGICITASRMLGLDRNRAIRFSMLLAIPSILGSLVLELVESHSKYQGFPLISKEYLLGTLTTMIIGLIAIWPCIKYMEKNGFVLLMIYRIIIGLTICFV
ncbi:MAG: undecaprenyl-diphosphate phosphatase [Holosporales bacterium]|jgi:undecaprenyl-diphosphatase|nr:undecaprenyl-diphosphate phosphatase [Holosporales bacterium]